ncbi:MULTISPECIES: glycosyltransferase family 4 protein [Stenotrophomonas]|jgi:UDP-N-acetylmuramyl pentapeptide phosphotransferase/UDP-N-acetylglucosamine-1-phosphate transferase|uniref:Glycosyltransferase family 4 protein n=1 Tax=Stenotrophomonas aracearum TaxID=3003272 RepID=A0ABY9YIF7_9GAMM|nr:MULTISPECIES: glycosyltransferase family 4 protein [unclassified Stenotrophomonas]WNH50225.1 glycosyltransferase family 4 protein [Stenotrophomonas sp. A5588]
MFPGVWIGLLAVLAVAAVLTACARYYALRRNLLDQPGERRSHGVATPRGGGIAIVLTLLLAVVAGAFYWPQARTTLLVFGLGLALVAGIGWWDDHRPLPAVRRLLVHVVAASLLAGLVWNATGNPWQAALALLFTTSLINIWNFMDGINGIATTQAILAGAAFALVLPGPLALAGVVLALACLGFLPFNFPRARIFMGDVGSGALGYAVAALVCLASVATTVSWLLLLVPLTAFLVDAGFTLLARMLSGQRWMEPHTQHLYQRAVKGGATHTSVTGMYFVFGLFSITVFNACTYLQPRWEAAVAVTWIISATGLWLLLRKGMRH